MNDSNDNPQTNRRTSLALAIVIGVAVTGYFVGINDGVPRKDASMMATTWSAEGSSPGSEQPESHFVGSSTMTVPATSYTDMRRRESGPTARWEQSLDQIPQPAYDLMQVNPPEVAEKQRSLRTRASRRAFNGAPPIIPHAVENTADAACYVCHGQGMRIGQRVANRMSHGFLANCMQCHAPPSPKPFEQWVSEVDNGFDGVAAPMQGERAFPGAPPTVPHSTWMRQNCLSCHGQEAGWNGLQSTHPWRINCQQCHAPSARLDQTIAGPIEFLPPPSVTDR